MPVMTPHFGRSNTRAPFAPYGAPSISSGSLDDDSDLRSVLTSQSTSTKRLRGLEYVIKDDSGAMRALVHGDQWIFQPMDRAEPAPKPELLQEFDTAADVHWLRQRLELGMGDIAALFKVTRKTVYDWIGGQKATKADYIKAVRALVEQELDEHAQPYLRHFWEEVGEGDEALLNILKAGDPTRIGSDARRVLRALKRPLLDYVESLRSEAGTATAAHIHNHDEYRGL